jgi:hypothetical protein
MRFIKVQTREVHHFILLSLPPYAALGLNPIRIQRQYSQSESTNVTTSTYTILVSALAIIIDYPLILTVWFLASTRPKNKVLFPAATSRCQCQFRLFVAPILCMWNP